MTPQRFDVVVVGGGPAGLSAALNAQLEGFSTLLVEKAPTFGGRAAQSAAIDNVLGLAVTGPNFAHKARAHAESHGVRFVRGDVLAVEPGVVTTADGRFEVSAGVVIATGLQWKHLPVPGLSDAMAWGKARYGCMFEDAHRLRGKRVAVLGGANSAAINALHFAQCGATDVLMLVRSSLEGTSHYLRAQITATRSIHRYLQVELERVSVTAQGLELTLSGGTCVLVDELFLFPDARPQTDFVPCLKDTHGFLWTDPTLMTSLSGVFAVGDVRMGSVKRIAAAIGDGATVVHQIHNWLRTRGAQQAACAS